MKVLGINGSPRIGGNTDILLEKAMEGARSKGAKTEKIFLNELNIAPCQEQEYENVNDEGFSVVDDDIHIVFRKMQEADVLILASPIFFGSLSAQAKTMIDRFQCVWVAKNMLKKEIFTKKIAGAFICVEAGLQKDFFDNAKSIVRYFFVITGISYKEEAFYPGLDKKGSVLEHPEYLESAFELGRKMAAG